MQPTTSISFKWALHQLLFGLWLMGITVGVLLFSFAPSYDLKAGDVAPQDIRAPHDATYTSQILTLQAQEDAVRRVALIYTDPDPLIVRQQYERARQVLAYLRELRADVYATEAQHHAWVLAVPELNALPLNVAHSVLSLSESDWNRAQLEFLDVLDQVMRQQRIREEDLLSVRARIPAQLSLDLTADQATLVAELVQRFLKPNVFYNEAATQKEREAVRAAATAAPRNFREGQIIVREGSVISALDMEALEEFELTSQDFELWDNGDDLLFAGALLLGLALYLWRLYPEALDAGRQEVLLAILLTVFLILTRLLIPTGDLLPYLFPGAALTMLIAVTLDRTAAIGAMLFLGSVCGWIADGSLGFAVLMTAQGIVAALLLPRYENTGSFFRAGLLSGGGAALLLLAFNLAELDTAPLSLLMKVGVCLVGGLISGGFTIGILFLLTPLFDLTTTFRLMELSRPNHPLLQRLLREAPATFNHVMMVASLAEQAAERIGGNVLLTRVGAYYHDIGKLLRPYFFIENQQGLSNPHDRLDPYTSVEVLAGHIRDGIRLAQEYHLPARIVAFISEHHGTMRASFFYQKAVEAAGGDADLVDEANFRYPGPTPRSRETALLMLADSCEAATRARRPSTPEELAEIVNAIFDQRMRDGQFDHCPITMQELHLAKTTYIELLRAAYHPRINYPEPKPTKNDDKDENHEPKPSH